MTSPVIYIPSKGRAGRAKTVARLIEEKTPFYLVVEPQDTMAYVEAYCKENPLVKVTTLPENNKGITYVRNYIMEMAKAVGHQYIWVVDDDLNGVGYVIEGKIVKGSYHGVLGGAQELLSRIENLVVGGLEYQQFAWSAKKEYAFNSYCDTCVMLNMKNARNFKYRENLKEDRDFALQALQAGYVTARTSMLCFSNPKNGSNVGGLHDEYKSGKEALWSKRMMELWPGVCEPSPKTDRVDVRIKWRLFKDNQPIFRDAAEKN